MVNRVLPVVDLLFVCREVTFDEESETYRIHDPLGPKAMMPAGVTGNFVVEGFTVFAQVHEGIGEFQLRAEIRDEADFRIARSTPDQCVFSENDRFLVQQFAFDFSRVEFEKPGEYEVVLLAGEKELEPRRRLSLIGGD